MIQHKINLKSYSFAAASRTMVRLKKFIKDKNIKALLIFQLPERGLIKGHTGLKVERFCPYCTSKLVLSINGKVCSGERLPEIAKEIRKARQDYGEQAEVMLTRRALRFYDMFCFEGRLTCDYVEGNEESRWRRNWN